MVYEQARRNDVGLVLSHRLDPYLLALAPAVDHVFDCDLCHCWRCKLSLSTHRSGVAGGDWVSSTGETKRDKGY